MTSSTLASEFVTDTIAFALVLRIEKRRLRPTTKSIFESTEIGKTTVYVPTLVFTEILYLSEKQKITLSIDTATAYLKQFPVIKNFL